MNRGIWFSTTTLAALVMATPALADPVVDPFAGLDGLIGSSLPVDAASTNVLVQQPTFGDSTTTQKTTNISDTDPLQGQQTVTSTSKDQVNVWAASGIVTGVTGGQQVTGSYGASATVTQNVTSTQTDTSVPNPDYDPAEPVTPTNLPFIVTTGTPTPFSTTEGTTPKASDVALNYSASTPITGMATANVVSSPDLTDASGNSANVTASAGVVSTSGITYATGQGTATYAYNSGKITTSLEAVQSAHLDSTGLTLRHADAAGDTIVSLSATGLDNGGNVISNVAAGTGANDAVNVAQLGQGLEQVYAASSAYTDASLATEAGLRTAGDAATLTSARSYTDASLATEAGLRTAGDAATLTSARSYTDASLATEAGLRTAGDAATLTSARSYTDASLATEAGLRTAGDAATLTSARSYTDASLVTEAGLRTAGDAATLTSARSYTDASLVTEAGLRTAGDAATLQSANSYTDVSVSTERQRAIAAETNLGQAVAAEATRAMSAEAQLGNRISVETARAQAAELQLDRKINASTAMAAALSGTSFLPNTRFNLSGSVATYHGATAGAVQGAFLITPNAAVNAGVAFRLGGGSSTNGNNAIGRVGVTFGW